VVRRTLVRRQARLRHRRRAYPAFDARCHAYRASLGCNYRAESSRAHGHTCMHGDAPPNEVEVCWERICRCHPLNTAHMTTRRLTNSKRGPVPSLFPHLHTRRALVPFDPPLTFPCIVGVYCSSSFGSWERQSAVRVTHTLNKTRPNTRPPALFLTTAVRTLTL
jgi:hypothetical protein